MNVYSERDRESESERETSEWRHRLHVVVRGTCSWFVYHPTLASRTKVVMKGQIALSPRYHPTTGPEFPSTVQQFMSHAAGPLPTAAPTAATVSPSKQNVNNGKGLVMSP